MKKKRLLFVANWPNTIYTEMFSALASINDFEIIVIIGKQFYKKSLPSFYKPYPMKHLYLKKGFKEKDTIHMPYYPSFTKIIDAYKPQILGTNVIHFPSTLQSYFYAKKRNIPFYFHTEMHHISNHPLLNLATKTFLFLFEPVAAYASYIFPWTTDGTRFTKQYFPSCRKKIIMIPVGINYSKYQMINVKKSVSKRTNFLCVARFVPYKNHHVLLQAVEHLKQKRKNNFHLSLLGEGPLKESIKQKVYELALQEYISFLDPVSHNKMPKLYASYDVFILPSYNEAIGLSVLEAMAAGLPVIVSDTVGAKMYMSNNKNGFIVKTGSCKALAKRMELLMDPPLCQYFSLQSKQLAKKYDMMSFVKQYNTLLKKVV